MDGITAPEGFSEFEEQIRTKWESIRDRGVMRYSIKCPRSQESRIFSFNGLAGVFQLSSERAENRRAPEEITDIDQPFNTSRFNFTKISEEEIISSENDTFLIINASPVDYGSCLIVPELHSCLPQKITEQGLRDTLEVMRKCRSWSVRVGFNSLTAYASVNHQHFHIYYLAYHLGIEKGEAVALIPGVVYTIKDWPAKGFVFELSDGEELENALRKVMTLVRYLQDSRISHNLFMTRGTSLQGTESVSDRNPLPESASDHYSVIRIFVWVRQPSLGAKNPHGFNAALCELAGHILVKDMESFTQTTPDEVAQILNDVTEEPFTSVRDVLTTIYAEV